MILSEVSWKEVADFLDDSVVAVLPLGAIEQHGFHLPLNTDTYCAENISRRAIDRAGNSAKIILLPTVSFGFSATHMAFAGTISLSAQTFMAVVGDICRAVIKHGVKRIVLLNGHVGNVASAGVVATQINVETGAAVLLVNWWDLCGDEIKRNFGFMFHACEAETSVAMALGLNVNLERAKGSKPESDIEFVKYNMFSGGPRVQASIRTLNELSETGAVGSPERASREKGKEIVDATIERLSNLLIEFSRSKEAPSSRAHS